MFAQAAPSESEYLAAVPGRPRKPEPKEDVIRVRVDSELYRRAQAAAERMTVDLSTYVRIVLKERLDADDAEAAVRR